MLIVIGLGSANIRIGLATQDAPLNIPHCIARYANQIPKFKVQDQVSSYLPLFYLFTALLCFVVNFFSLLDAEFADYNSTAHGTREGIWYSELTPCYSHFLSLRFPRNSVRLDFFFLPFFLKIASLLKIPFLDEEVANNSFPRKVPTTNPFSLI